ncbi:MiaB/RimO family radical SAM methylthiotransferase [Patescibacteria group bacterium]|nr:MiaB/RimO family radical SAM methylthiotransferase [Patescibacteria group bacterium]
MLGKKKKFYIKTFGCIQNVIDSEKIRNDFLKKGFIEVYDYRKSDLVIINSCIVRETAENRVYGLINNIRKLGKNRPKVLLSGCLARLLLQNKKKLGKIKNNFPEISRIKVFEGFSAQEDDRALISISNGCNNFCSYCIVPFCRGREKSKNFKKIIKEVDRHIKEGVEKILLVGQNVNSYGADFDKTSSFFKLLEKIAKKKLKNISFISSNPWDFSDELIEVISKYKNIDRLIHLPLQSGDDEILKKMKRPYTSKEYLSLVRKIRKRIKGVRFSTDIIVGFPGETKKAFKNTVELCKKVGFEIAYLNKYSPRRGTLAAKLYEDNVPMKIKKKRWKVLEKLINKKN